MFKYLSFDVCIVCFESKLNTLYVIQCVDVYVYIYTYKRIEKKNQYEFFR